MANTLITPSWITKETAYGYRNSLEFGRNITKQYNGEFKQSGAKMGQTINVRMPVRFQIRNGQALQLQNIFESSVPVVLSNQSGVDFSWSSVQATTQIDEIRDRYVMPAAQVIAGEVDRNTYATVVLDVFSAVGTPGTTPSAYQTYLNAGVKLSDQAVQKPGRVAILDLQAMATLANTNSTLFNPAASISESTRSGEGASSNFLGFAKWRDSQSVSGYTTGSFTASTPIVSGANQTGSTLSTTGWANGATSLALGDIFTIAGVRTVNPVTKNDTGRLQQFVITAATADSGGAIAALPFQPSIVTSGPLQTVNASPAANAAITVVGSTGPVAGTMTATFSPQSLLFHPEAFTLATADLVMPDGGAEASRVSSPEYGIAIRWVKQYQIGSDQNDSRFDVLYGPKTLQARLAARVQG